MSSTAPKRRLDVRQQTSERATGKRAASRPSRARRTYRPSLGMLGTAALVVAGLGTAIVSTGTDDGALTSNYQAISASYTGEGTESTVDVSRSFDRETFEAQSRSQADQMLAAQQELQQKVDATAQEFKANQWVLPVTGYNLSARFGQRSRLWSSGQHTGLDFAGPSGSTIVSVAAGTVTSVGFDGAYGNKTVITLDDGTEIWYAHQSRTIVQKGQRVDPGQTIGYTGSTGNTTGPHLHLEVHPGGSKTAVDPIPVFREHNVTP